MDVRPLSTEWPLSRDMTSLLLEDFVENRFKFFKKKSYYHLLSLQPLQEKSVFLEPQMSSVSKVHRQKKKKKKAPRNRPSRLLKCAPVQTTHATKREPHVAGPEGRHETPG
eukprot:1105842_1